MKHTIEFELKDFNNIFNQNKEVSGYCSPTYKYGEYSWSIQADVNKYKFQVNGDLWFTIRLFCETDEKNNFPLFARMNFSILNKDKDLRKALLKCN